MLFRTIIAILFFSIFITSCNDNSSNEEKSSQSTDDSIDENVENILSFVHQLDGFTVLGKIDLLSLIEKSGVKNDLIVGAVVSPLSKNINDILGNSSIYYCLKLDDDFKINLNPEDLLKNSNAPKGQLFAFVSLENSSRTKNEMEKLFQINLTKNENTYQFSDDNYCILLNESLMLFAFDLDTEKSLDIETIDKYKSYLVNTGVKEYYQKNVTSNMKKLLHTKGDISFTYSLQESVEKMIYNFEINKSSGLKNLLQELNDCYNQTSISFENGLMTIISDNILSDTMNRWNVLGADTKKIVERLGRENPSVSVALNMNVSEMQSIYDYYLRESLNEIKEKNFLNSLVEINEFIDVINEEGLTSLFEGELGASMYIENDGIGNIPNLNAFAKLGKNTISMLYFFIESLEANGGKVEIKDNEVCIQTSLNYAKNKNQESYSQVFNEFGEFPFNAFVDLNSLNWKDLIPDQNIIKIVENLSTVKLFISDNKFNLHLTSKNEQENILETIVKSFLKTNFNELLGLLNSNT